MCGRYVITKPIDKTAKFVKAAINVDNKDNYNAHPYQKLPIIKKYINGYALELLQWGIVPLWANKKNFKPLINARLETINEKVTFKKLIKKSRCIIVADGFYEWKRDKKNKLPYYIYRENKEVIYIAGIFDNNQFCMITENASADIKALHHRKPVILYENDLSKYLNQKNEVSIFLNDCKKPNLIYHEISKEVNKPTNNNSNLINKL